MKTGVFATPEEKVLLCQILGAAGERETDRQEAVARIRQRIHAMALLRGLAGERGQFRYQLSLTGEFLDEEGQ